MGGSFQLKWLRAMAVEIIDQYYLTFSLIITVAFQLFGWAVAVWFRTETHYDFFGGLNYIAIALMTLCLKETYTIRQVVVTFMVVLSRAELAGFLAYRACQRSGDARFETAKDDPLVMLVFWMLQVVWVWVVVLPAIFINGSGQQDPALGAFDYIGFALMVIGFLCEVVSDFQKYAFRNNPANNGLVCDVGLWYYSRHPNYFGEPFAHYDPAPRGLGDPHRRRQAPEALLQHPGKGQALRRVFQTHLAPYSLSSGLLSGAPRARQVFLLF